MRLPLIGQTVVINTQAGPLPAMIIKRYGDYQSEEDITLDVLVFSVLEGQETTPLFGVRHGNEFGQWQWPDIEVDIEV